MKYIFLLLITLMPFSLFAQPTIHSNNLGRYDIATIFVAGGASYGIKIKTNIPATVDGINDVFIKGSEWGSSTNIDMHLSWQTLSGNINDYHISESGTFSPDAYLYVESGLYVIHFDYYAWTGDLQAAVTATNINGDPSWFTGWAITDESVDWNNATLTQFGYYNQFPYVYAQTLSSSSVSANFLNASSGNISTLNSNTIQTGTLNVNGGGGILSTYTDIQPYGLYFSKYSNHITQNAYYTGSWKSYLPGSQCPTAVLWSTGAEDNNSFEIYTDKSITNANETLGFTNIFNVTRDGLVGIGVMNPSASLHITDNNTPGTPPGIKLQKNGSITSAIYNDGNLHIEANGGSNSWINSTDATNLYLVTGGGSVGIGTSNTSDANYKLFVETGIRTRKVKVDVDAWPDYVFDSAYAPTPLTQVAQYIKDNKHLPGVPSAAEVTKEGVNLGDNQAVLLKKIEELTLYTIQQETTNQQQAQKINQQDAAIKILEDRIQRLEKMMIEIPAAKKP